MSGLPTHALPALRERALHAGFAVIVGECQSDWSQLDVLLEDGHEIISHSISHPHITTADAAFEVTESKQLLDANVPGQVTSFFAFPYDEVNTGVLEVVRESGYLGARGGYGRNGVNASDFPDPFLLEYDAYGPYTPYPGYADHPLAVLNAHVDAALAQGGWALREVHGVADASWEPVPLDVYLAHLDYLVGLVSTRELWVAPPSEVIRYRYAREHCGRPSLVGATLAFEGADSDCAQFATELTIALVAERAETELHATQLGVEASVERVGQDRVLVSVDPLAGPVTLAER